MDNLGNPESMSIWSWVDVHSVAEKGARLTSQKDDTICNIGVVEGNESQVTQEKLKIPQAIV
jgi:hypothetical protein